MYDHCVRCEICRMRQVKLGIHDWVPARLVAGIVSMVLLAGVMRIAPARKGEIFEGIAYSPLTFVTVPVAEEDTDAIDALEADTGDGLSLTADHLASRGSHRSSSRMNIAELRPIGPYRPFTPPPRRLSRQVEPVRLPPPPALRARIDAPTIIAGTPQLDPPRRHPFKKFVSILAVPFRHI